MNREAIEEAKIVLEDGTELTQWDSYSIDSDFLTPTDGWSFSVGDEKLHTNKAYTMLQPDTKVQIFIGGALQLTGVIDSVDFDSSISGGTVCNVQGRDILRSLCKSNIWPGFKVKDLSVIDMVDKVLQTYFPGGAPEVFYDDISNRKVIGINGAYNAKDRTAKQKKIIERSQANPNEGAFSFLIRNIRRHGLWIWATADGNVVVGGPEYDQEPSYKIVRKLGGSGSQWIRSSYKWDRTNIPSFLEVRGKSAAKEWGKTSVVGIATDPNAYHGTPGIEYYNGVVESRYLQHDEATTKEQALAYAKQEMSRLKQNERVYTVTAAGHRDKKTKNVFAINTIAFVDDAFVGVQEEMFVIGRTFNKDVGGGTTTSIRMVEKGSIQFSEVDWE